LSRGKKKTKIGRGVIAARWGNAGPVEKTRRKWKTGGAGGTGDPQEGKKSDIISSGDQKTIKGRSPGSPNSKDTGKGRTWPEEGISDVGYLARKATSQKGVVCYGYVYRMEKRKKL